MVFIGIMSYPPESTKEQAKRWMELPPLPAYITMKGPYVSSEVGAGIKTITIYEYDQSKFTEAMEALGARYAKYFGVPGLTYSLHPWLEVKEALKAVGMGEKPKGK
jgi:phage portal protein BeeE